MKPLTTSSADIILECRVMFGVKSVSKSILSAGRQEDYLALPTNVLIAYRALIVYKNTVGGDIWLKSLVYSCIPARQWTDIRNTRCSILSRFSHFHVSQFPPLQVGAANSCLAFSTPATRCRIFMSRKFMTRIFSVPWCGNFANC